MSELVAAARRYLGVPFRHRGRTARGLDCVGLAWKAYQDCGLTLPDFRHYPPEPNDGQLIRHIEHAIGLPITMGPVAESLLEVGDVVVFRFVKEPHHVGIVTDYPFGESFGLIHARAENMRVVEHRLSPDYIARITHVFRNPV